MLMHSKCSFKDYSEVYWQPFYHHLIFPPVGVVVLYNLLFLAMNYILVDISPPVSSHCFSTAHYFPGFGLVGKVMCGFSDHS